MSKPEAQRYAIPSLNRVGTLATKTLPLLHRLGVLNSQIDVWVDPDQATRYERLGLNVRIAEPLASGPQRVGRVRNAMARGYPVGTRLIEIDDDVTRICVGWRGHRLRDVTPEEWRKVLAFAWGQCEVFGLWLWGPYPVFNDYFMRPNATTDLRYVTGTLFGTILRHDPCELVTLDDKEDFERNLRHLLRDSGFLRLNWLAYETKYYVEPGGMQSYRTPQLVKQGALRLAELFPGLCKYAGPVGKNGNAEVTLCKRGTGATLPIGLPEWLRRQPAHA